MTDPNVQQALEIVNEGLKSLEQTCWCGDCKAKVAARREAFATIRQACEPYISALGCRNHTTFDYMCDRCHWVLAQQRIQSLEAELAARNTTVDAQAAALKSMRQQAIKTLEQELATLKAKLDARLPDVEVVAAHVHEAWMKKNLDKGITSRKSQSDGEEFMVPYEQLSEDAKDSDRITVRAVYAAIEKSRVSGEE